MGKIIVHNQTDLLDSHALERVCGVMSQGNVSRTAGRDHPCHATTYQDGIAVYCINRGKDKNTFYVVNREGE